ncbi:hypothetical protein EMCRGX_G009746 [Ephydatia muelleri]
MLCSLPTVFYVLAQATSGNTSAECIGYSKTTCLQTLTQRHRRCLLAGKHYISIVASVDQDTNEKAAQLVQSDLSSIGVSDTCRSSIMDLVCSQLFPLCGNGTAYGPSLEECARISTVDCKDDWQKTSALSSVLPSGCSSFPATSLVCEAKTPITNGSGVPASDSVRCNEQFILRNGTCQPICDRWKVISVALADSTFGLTIILATAAGVFGVILLVISLKRRKKMFSFPSIIIVYMSGASIIFALFVLIASTSRRLFCSSENTVEAIRNPSPYCIVMGCIFYYGLLHVLTFWISHVGMLFYKVAFPFESRLIESYSKRFNLGVVLAALALPCIPIIVAFSTGGFLSIGYPQLVCVIKNSNAEHYSYTLPSSLIIATGISLLVVIATIIIKSNGKYKRQTDTAEIKLLFVLCYYAIAGSMVIVAFTYNAIHKNDLVEAMIQFISCESLGTSAECDAEKKAYEPLAGAEIWIVTYVFIAVFPAIELVYVVKLKKTKLRSCDSEGCGYQVCPVSFTLV